MTNSRGHNPFIGLGTGHSLKVGLFVVNSLRARLQQVTVRFLNRIVQIPSHTRLNDAEAFEAHFSVREAGNTT